MAHERNSDILNNTYGIFFLGTPHRGTQYAGYARRLASRLNRLYSNPDIFLPLEVNSTYLVAQHDNFMWQYEGRIQIVNFYETHRLEILRNWIYKLSFKIMVNTNLCTVLSFIADCGEVLCYIPSDKHYEFASPYRP